MGLIVIEGLDGSGKATQAAALAGYFSQIGKKFLHLSFPNYTEESSALVRLYLSGKLGKPGDVSAYAASSFYAADRYISYITGWEKEYRQGYTILADRYVTSNATHQMSKLPRDEWDGYLGWIDDYEYVKLGLPRPDIVVYLDMHPQTSRKLLEKRRRDKGVAGDIHERDIEYLGRCREAAIYACEKLGWRKIACDDGQEPLPVIDIFEQIKLLTRDI